MTWKVPELPQYVIDFGIGYRDGYAGTHIKFAVPLMEFSQDYENGNKAGAYDKKNDMQFQPEMWWGFTDGDGQEYDNRRKIKT
jgi:hypothetical protein